MEHHQFTATIKERPIAPHVTLGARCSIRFFEHLQCGFVQMPADRFAEFLIEHFSEQFHALVQLNGIVAERGIANIDAFTLQYFMFSVERQPVYKFAGDYLRQYRGIDQ